MKTNRRLEGCFERFRRDGDARALAQVFDETAPELLRLARHLARGGDAEDLVQATFLLVIEKRATFDASRELRPWLTGILLRHAASARRTLAREVDPSRLDERANPDPHAISEARELSEMVSTALAKLSAADREVLIPLLFDGRRAVEIARELGRRPDAIHMRVHRGLARLRRLLPAGFALALSSTAARAELARVRADVLSHAQRELGLATGAVAPFTVLGVAMSFKKVALVAVALALTLVGARFVAGMHSGIERSGVTPIASVAPSVSEVPRAQDIDVASSRLVGARSGARVAVASAASNEVEFEIVRADGEPAAGARVGLVRDEGRVFRATVDERGLATFASSSGDGDLFVGDAGAFPHRVRVPLAPARVRIELPRGEELAGRLLDRTGSPAAGVELQLTTDVEIAGVVGARIRELGIDDTDSAVARAVTSDDGSFHFHGLPTGWSGALEVLGGRVLVEDGAPTAAHVRWFAVSATGVILTTALRPRLTGQLVDAASRRPLANHAMEARIGQRSGDATTRGERTDASGRFEIALAGNSPAVSFQLLSARDSNGRGSELGAQIRFEPFDARHDLGVIEVAFEPARALDFAVRDAAGQPIPLARIAFDSGRSATCDSTGHARVEAVPSSTTRVLAAAPGHAVASVELHPQRTSPVEIVLHRTNELTIVLPEGVDPIDYRLKVRSSSPLFGSADRTYPQRIRGTMVGTCLGVSAELDATQSSTSFEFAADGRVVLEGIEAGAPFDLRVETRSEATAFELACAPMSAEERRLVRVALDVAPHAETNDRARTIRGRVVDESGRGIVGARVGNQVQSGSDGVFALTFAGTEAGRIAVSKRGFAPALLDLSDAPEPELRVVLSRGRDLAVRVVEASGRACEDAVVRVVLDGGLEVVAARDDAGRHWLRDLPARPVLVSTELSNRVYSVEADASDRTLTIEVPDHGRVEVAWSLPDDLPSRGSLRLVLQLPGGAGGPLQVRQPKRAQREHVLPHVLPGEYELFLELCGSLDASHECTTLRGPMRVVVAPGGTQRLELR